MYFIEKLTVYSWVFYIFPYFLGRSRQALRLYYIDATPSGLWLSRLMAASFKAEIKRLGFTFFAARDRKGEALWWKAQYDDFSDLLKYINNLEELQEITQRYDQKEKLRLFLTKRILFSDSGLNLIHILLFFRVASLKVEDEGGKTVDIFLVSSQRPWLAPFGQWAKMRNINIIPMKIGGLGIKGMLMKAGWLKGTLKQVMYDWMKMKYRMRNGIGSKEVPIVKDTSPKIAVEFYGYLNLDFPEMYSDLFFCQQSRILNKDILIYFQHPSIPATDQAWGQIKKHGMSAVVINSRATVTPQIPLFKPSSPRVSGLGTSGQDHGHFRKDLRQGISEYLQQRAYWLDFFTRYRIKMHVSWFRFLAGFYPMVDALQSTGGVSVVYQRSFEGNLHLSSVMAVDVFFGFSRLGAHLGKDTSSIIPYYVVTGYLGDYRFSILRKQANDIRHVLQSHGARKIFAYFDEESIIVDPRWHISCDVTQENYEFLLKKVIETPWLGLLLKPKVFNTLYQRLGPVSQLLDKAQETGRCYILKEGDHFTSNTPALAALAADVAIGHLFSGTACLEAALAGRASLLLDREGCSQDSLLYKLGDRVVFRNWDDLWKACLDHWNKVGTVPGLGDWSAMIEEMDPFRDGRAAERMATYLQWLMEGLKANLGTEVVLADAAERYTKIWGKDKVLSINSDRSQYENAFD